MEKGAVILEILGLVQPCLADDVSKAVGVVFMQQFWGSGLVRLRSDPVVQTDRAESEPGSRIDGSVVDCDILGEVDVDGYEVGGGGYVAVGAIGDLLTGARVAVNVKTKCGAGHRVPDNSRRVGFGWRSLLKAYGKMASETRVSWAHASRLSKGFTNTLLFGLHNCCITASLH